MSTEDDLIARQAYADILPRIEQLNALSGEDLASEMKQLKACLMQNPDACALMLPQDIGELVSALTRLSGEDIAASMAPKAKGRKPKEEKIAMTAEELAAAFDEL